MLSLVDLQNVCIKALCTGSSPELFGQLFGHIKPIVTDVVDIGTVINSMVLQVVEPT